jgi:hypothetical protein
MSQKVSDDDNTTSINEGTAGSGGRAAKRNRVEILIETIKKQCEQLEQKEREAQQYISVIEQYKAENDDLIAERLANSLYTAIKGTSIVKIKRKGTNSSHNNPSNHLSVSSTEKPFAATADDLLTAVDPFSIHPELKISFSGLLVKLSRISEPSYSSEADVASYVNLALEDALTTCNVLMNKIAPNVKVNLIVRQEMSIFSNRCDHAVVCDSHSNTTIFCVETKKHFHEGFQDEKNGAWGQCLDQLKAMQAMGHSCPLGAITCFNETYLTSLSPAIKWGTLPTLESLQALVDQLPKKNAVQSNGTPPPPLRAEGPIGTNQTPSTTVTTRRGAWRGARRDDEPFKAEERQDIVRSQSVEPTNLVGAFIIIILEALKGFYILEFQNFTTINPRIEVDCIRMTRNSYCWGKLQTTYKGPLHHPNPSLWNIKKAMHLIRCIGNGSTSKAYYAVTEDGFDCVVKMYVQSHDEDGNQKSMPQFKEDSKKCVKMELQNYTNIYGDELRGYVQTQTLNGFDCVIMPFFEPISLDKRQNDLVLRSIRGRLKQIARKNMAFHECDRKWRHVGRFNRKIFLFDLGDLVTCDNITVANKRATLHYDTLVDKANGGLVSAENQISTTMNTETSITSVDLASSEEDPAVMVETSALDQSLPVEELSSSVEVPVASKDLTSPPVEEEVPTSAPIVVDEIDIVDAPGHGVEESKEAI